VSRPAGDGAVQGSGRWRAWVAVAAVTLATWMALTWPLAVRMDGIWSVSPTPALAGKAAGPDTVRAGDHLQNAFIQSVVVDNLRELRNPYLDLREGAAGPEPLRTSSLDLPWTPVVAVLWPLAGLQTAYNATLLLSSVATGLAGFAWLRRHTRWSLLAAAGALAYSFAPFRMGQLSGHFNAVMWWAFPAALCAFEALLERWRAGCRWRGPAAALAAVTLTVAASGEYHLILYLSALLAFLVAFELLAALVGRRGVPWGPLAVALATVAGGMAYTLAAFHYVFGGSVQGSNGQYRQVEHFAPASALELVRLDVASTSEGPIYLGWVLLGLATAGMAAALLGRGRARAARPYAALLIPLLFLSLGPAADLGPVRLYRFVFDHVPFLSLQRVPQRLMVVTCLVVVLLAVVALDLAGRRLLAARPQAAPPAAVALVAGTALLLAGNVYARNVVTEDLAGNQVVAALREAGAEAGPIVGLPLEQQVSPWNSATTYIAALSRRQALNAYNQTPAPWLDERVRCLRSLRRGNPDAEALALLRRTGVRQLVVVNEPHIYPAGRSRALVDRLVRSGRFRPVVSDGPLTLLELTGPRVEVERGAVVRSASIRTDLPVPRAFSRAGRSSRSQPAAESCRKERDT
jgi:hypothetical protein